MDAVQQRTIFVEDSGKDIRERLDNEFIWTETDVDNETIDSKRKFEEVTVLENLVASTQKDAEEGLISSRQYLTMLSSGIVRLSKAPSNQADQPQPHSSKNLTTSRSSRNVK